MLIKIRLNKQATGDHDRWRLFITSAKKEFQELTVSAVSIEGCHVYTTAEVNEAGELKYNITVDYTSCVIHQGVAVIK